MQAGFWRRFFTFEGRITRQQYVLSAIPLAILKYLIDTAIAAHFGQTWHIYNYVFPPKDIAAFGFASPQRTLYVILWAVAIPFFWIGVSLTLRRLRDCGSSPRYVFAFFVPLLNLAQFIFLAVEPTSDSPSNAPETIPATTLKISPWWGVVIATVVGVPLVLLSTRYFAQYAWSLFLGVPFVTGFFTSWFYNAKSLHSRKETNLMCCITPVLIGLILIGFQAEGLICLAMAIPLAIPFSIAGGLVARYFLEHPCRPITTPTVTACIAILPLLMFTEHAANLQPPTAPVVTSIVVNAPVNVVWKNVIAFPLLAPPTEWLFQTGIAYPIGATITGSGPGAIRRCRFSTGDFVEPITIWDENHLLAFNVASEPPSMHEIGFGKVTTAHIEHNYMRSQHGQFRLTAIDDNHTLLEGTTWYQDYFWPQAYWRPISDAIIHRIHTRVLEHVKQQSERQQQESQPLHASSAPHSLLLTTP